MVRATEERFKQELDAREQLRDLVTPKVVRWEYHREEAWDWRPEFNIHLTKKSTTKNKANFAYGFDSSDRIIVIHAEIIISREDPSPIETFLRYCDNKLEVSEFDHLKLRLVSDVTFKNGRAIRIEQTYPEGSFLDKFEWNGKRLSKMQSYFGNQKSFREYVFDKSGKKITAEFRVRPDGRRVAARQPLPKGVTMKSLAKDIRKRLVNGVFEVVSAARIRGPIYCIALAYDGEGNGVFPPAIGIGLERERKEWIESHRKNAKGFIWNPAEFSNYEKDHTQIDDDDYTQACEWYSDAMMQKDSDAPAKKLINDVAADLAKLDWKSTVPITDDFVVVAIDFEGADFRKNLKKSASADVIKSLMDRGLI